MQVLILNFYYAPDFSADVPIYQGLVEGLVHHGHTVHLVVAAPHRQGGTLWEAYRGRLFSQEENGHVTIDRTWIYSKSDMTVPERMLNYLSYSVLALPRLFRRARPDVIFVGTPPPNMGLTGMLASRMRGAPYVLNVQDIYPDVAIRAGMLRNGRLAEFFQRIENLVYQKASRIAVISEGFRRNLLAKGVPDAKVAVLPNFVDTEALTPLPRTTPLRRELGLEDHIVVLYAGSLGHPQGLDRVLDVAAALQSRRDLFFLFVGEGTQKDTLHKQADGRRLSNVQFLDPRPWSEVPQVIATGDISLVPLRTGFSFDTVPSKLYSIMASGRPVIASVDPGSDTWALVETARCGLCVAPEDPDALAKAIVQLADDEALRQRLADAGRAHVVAHCSKTQMVKHYNTLFTEVVAEWKRAEVR